MERGELLVQRMPRGRGDDEGLLILRAEVLLLLVGYGGGEHFIAFEFTRQLNPTALATTLSEV